MIAIVTKLLEALRLDGAFGKDPARFFGTINIGFQNGKVSGIKIERAVKPAEV